MRGSAADAAKGNVSGLLEAHLFGMVAGEGGAGHARALEETPEGMDFSGNTSLVD